MGSAATAGTFTRDVFYKPWPSQQRFHHCGRRFKGYSGPVGSGKSLALVHEAIRLSLVNAGRWGLIGAPTYPVLRDSTQRAFFEVLDDSEIPYDFHKSEETLVLTELGNSVIIFRSMDKPDRLRGTNLAWFGLDEMTYCQESAFLRLQGRLRDPLASEFVGFGVWTPNGYDWVYDKFIGDKKSSDYEAVIGSPGENKALPSDYYASLAHSYDDRFYRQEVLGEYLPLSTGKVYYAFDRTRNVRACHYLPVNEICWSLDFNVNPMCSVIAQIHDASSRMDMLSGRRQLTIEMLDEICLPDSNIPEACGAFVKRTEAWATRGQLLVHVYGDPAGSARTHAGKSDWQLVKEYFARDGRYKLEFHIPPSHPAVKDRVNAVNAALLNSAGETRLWVDPCNKDLIRDLEQVTWKADSHGNSTGDLDKANSKLTHVSDAAGYLIEQVLGLRQTGGYGTGFMSGGRN